MKKFFLCLLIIFSVIMNMNLNAICEEYDIVSIYISKYGLDTNSGERTSPLKSLNKAFEEAEKFNNKKCTIHINIVEDFYEIEKGIIIENEKVNNTVIVKGDTQNKENVIISGAKTVDISNLKVVTDLEILSRLPKESQGKVVSIDLKKQGLTGLGIIPKLNYGKYTQKSTELICNGELYGIARWPNGDEYAKTGGIIYPGYNIFEINVANDPGIIFKADAPRLDKWADAKDAWLVGYWMYNWAMDSLKISHIENEYIFTETSSAFGIKKNAMYYIYNLLEEMDAEGEWYIDSQTDVLYFYKPTNAEIKNLSLTNLEEPLLKFSNAKNVFIENIVFEGGKDVAITLQNCVDVEIRGCKIRGFGMNAVNINKSLNSGIRSCEIYNTGAGGVFIDSGNRSDLKAMSCYAVNNNIYNYSRLYKVYMPAVKLNGVGNVCANNKIHNAPHMAIGFFGNNHVVERNEVYDVLKESNDAGAIYFGRDWLGFGNTVRYNYIHDLKGVESIVVGIYFDDMFSGASAYGNIINNVPLGFLMGGGHSNTIKNNIMIAPKGGATRAINADSRGLRPFFIDLYRQGGQLYQRMSGIPYTNQVWQENYPVASTFLNDEPHLPKRCNISNNIAVGYNKFQIEKEISQYGFVDNNVILEDGLGITFGDKITIDENSIIYDVSTEFKKIPVDKIGLYNDNFRKDAKLN